MAVSKTGLYQDIASYFPDNTSGAISAADLRYVSSGIVNAMVDFNSSGFLQLKSAANSGNIPQVQGSMYFNTTSSGVYIYTGLIWKQLAYA